MKALCVGGSFDLDKAKPSGYFKKLTESLSIGLSSYNFIILNGGTLVDLESALSTLTSYDLIIWAANIPNTYPKFVNSIKEKNPTAMLVITKNNREGNYTRKLLAARALKAKANLLIEFTNSKDGNICASVIDPLGNCFINSTSNVTEVANTLTSRLQLLTTMTRVGSEQVLDLGKNINISNEMADFFELTRQYAARFHTLIHADDNGRMLGNISFRCESGFPSLRGETSYNKVMLVSRRNVDKRDIGFEGMVPVSLAEDGTAKVKYSGEHKPSVDTPIQRSLYNVLPYANFMLHAHVYIKDAPYTETVIPCGALEEADEIIKALPKGYKGSTLQYLNLIGHGSLVIAPRADMLKNIPYIERELP